MGNAGKDDSMGTRIGVVYIAADSDGLQIRFAGHWDKED